MKQATSFSMLLSVLGLPLTLVHVQCSPEHCWDVFPLQQREKKGMVKPWPDPDVVRVTFCFIFVYKELWYSLASQLLIFPPLPPKGEIIGMCPQLPAIFIHIPLGHVSSHENIQLTGSEKQKPPWGGRTNILKPNTAPWNDVVAFGQDLLPFWIRVLASKVVAEKLQSLKESVLEIVKWQQTPTSW